MDASKHNRLAISPPPLKRRRQNSDLADSQSLTPNSSEDAAHQSMSYPMPPSHWLRVFSWNINGIAPFLQLPLTLYLQPKNSNPEPESTCSLRSFLRRHHWPQMLHLQEVKINPSDQATCRALEKAVNKGQNPDGQEPRYTVKLCLPRDKFNARAFGGKIYGVATVIRDDFLRDQVLETRQVEWDMEGRVLIVETRSKLCFLNVYAVNGTANPYRDPLTGAILGNRHDRKLQFHKHMLAECKQLESQGYRIILAGDLNVAPARIDGHPNLRIDPEQHVKHRADFNQKFLDESVSSGLGAIDSFRYLHPGTKRYTYVPRNVPWGASCDRVDQIILSKSLVSLPHKALKEADIFMTEMERGPSDHVPLFVSLDISNLP